MPLTAQEEKELAELEELDRLEQEIGHLVPTNGKKPTFLPAHKPTEIKQKPFLKRFGEKLAIPFEAIGKGLGESELVQPIEGVGLAGDIANILVQPTRLAGQLASIPFTGMADILKGKPPEKGIPPPELDFFEVEDLIKKEGIPSAITKYGLETVMLASAKLGIPVQSLLTTFKIPALGLLAQRMRRISPEKPIPKAKPKAKPSISPEAFEETQAIPLTEVEKAEQMKDIIRERQRKAIAKQGLLPTIDKQIVEGELAKPLTKVTGTAKIKEELTGQKESPVLPGQEKLFEKEIKPRKEIFYKEKFSNFHLRQLSETFMAANSEIIYGREPNVASVLDILGREANFTKMQAEKQLGRKITTKEYIPIAIKKLGVNLIKEGRNRVATLGETLSGIEKYGWENPFKRVSKEEEPVPLGSMGYPLYSGIPIPELQKTFKAVSDKTAQVLENAKAKFGVPEQAGVQAGIQSMWQHHKAVRDAEFVSRDIKTTFDNLKLPIDRQTLLINALEQPNKYAGQLSSFEKGVYEWLKIERDKVSKFAEETGLLEKGQLKENYLFHWWLDPKTGEPYFPMYGRINPRAPQLKQRAIPTYEEGIAQGLKPATINPAELIQKSMVALTRASASREMLKTLKTTEAGLEGALERSSVSIEAKPLRLVERWDLLRKQGLTEGYERYDNWFLDKPIVFKDASGNTHILKGQIGVVKELFPYVKAYFETPTYGNLSKVNFGLKSLKLMSGFHILSLNWQAIAGAPLRGKLPILNVVSGFQKMKGGGETLRLLYKNGLELKGYEDIGSYYGGTFNIPTKAGKVISAGLNAVQRLTFNVFHPGIKVNTAFQVLEDMTSRMESRLDRPITLAEKETLAKQTVHYVDRLFSGEDYRTALLNTNQWMAKYFYSPKARKRWQSTLISPQWQKAHIGILADITKSIFSKEGRKAPDAYLYRQYLYNALGIYAGANLYNWVMSKHRDGEGKAMSQNEGHNSFSVRAPYEDPDGRRVFWRPLKSIFEIPELLSDPIGRVISKTAPWIQTAAAQIKPPDWRRYEGIGGSLKRVLDVGRDISPMPTATLFQPSKATPSKVLSLIGLPSSKGLSETQIRAKIKEEIAKGNMEEVSRLIRELVQVQTGGIKFKVQQKTEKALEKVK